MWKYNVTIITGVHLFLVVVHSSFSAKTVPIPATTEGYYIDPMTQSQTILNV